MILSVIIPVYNVESYLHRAISSLINNSTSDEVEFIFVNDGSTDGSKSIINDFQKKDKRVCLYNKKNSGSGLSRNMGFEKSSGEYVYFMDPDDWVDDNFFSTLLEILKKQSGYDVLGFGHNVYLGKKLYRSIRSAKEISYCNSDEIKWDFLADALSIFPVWNKVYRRSFLEKYNLKFSNQKTGQDALFNLNALSCANSIKVISDIMYNYVAHRKGSAQSKFNPLRINDDYKVAQELEKFILNHHMNIERYYEYLVNIEYNNFRMSARAGIYLQSDNMKISKISLKSIKSVKCKAKILAIKRSSMLTYIWYRIAK